MNKILLALACAFFAMRAHSQVSYGGEPIDWNSKEITADIPFERMPEINLIALAAEDAIMDQHKELPYRFGFEHSVSLGIENSGRIIFDEASGKEVWQLGIHCPGALSISLRFDQFRIPKGGTVFIWSADRTEFIGAFDHRSNKPEGMLAVGMVHGEQIVVEYSYPAGISDRGDLEIGLVVHTYRPFVNSPFLEDALEAIRGPFGDSGNCEVNVNCPAGDDWQIEKRSVAVIVEGGWGLCSGALVNNTANDGTPYFLTADHCLVGSTSNWVFYFNHESNNCNGSTGPTNQSISGAEVVASNSDSDFALLLLDDTPPASYNVQYAGWDATDAETVESACCIHHPGGDIKKISLEEDEPYHDTAAGADVWWIDNWETGVTEGGSSGSPLFDQNHRVIGQLYGGASGCIGSNGNGQFDYYGRFGVSWDNGNNASSRLRDWLDPGNTGVLVLDGYPDGFVAIEIDASVGAIGNVASFNCSSNLNPTFQLTNQGSQNLTSCVINYQLNNGTIQFLNWNGNLEQGESEIVNLPTISASNGNNTFEVWVTNPNGQTDGNEDNNSTSITFSAITGEAFDVNIMLHFDNYPEETSWELVSANNVVLFSGDNYDQEPDGSTLNIPVCLPEGCYEFVIYDEEGDGLCCVYGFGEYTVTNQFGQEVASGANFDSEEATEFCISATNVQSLEKEFAAIYPNPASSNLTISSREIIIDMQIVDVTGRTIAMFQPNSQLIQLDLTPYVNGWYSLRLTTSTGSQSSKLLIRK